MDVHERAPVEFDGCARRGGHVLYSGRSPAPTRMRKEGRGGILYSLEIWQLL